MHLENGIAWAAHMLLKYNTARQRASPDEIITPAKVLFEEHLVDGERRVSVLMETRDANNPVSILLRELALPVLPADASLAIGVRKLHLNAWLAVCTQMTCCPVVILVRFCIRRRQHRQHVEMSWASILNVGPSIHCLAQLAKCKL